MNKLPMPQMGGSGSLARTLCIGAALLLASPLVSLATTVVVVVTVIAPPSCEINSKKPIEVTFGEVLTTQVNGDNYKQDVLYDIKCTNTTSNDMSIRIQGTDVGLGAHVLGTDTANLGIALLNNGKPVPLNSDIKFTYPNPPKLQAVPVKSPGTTLKGGAFSASATMTMTYQ